MPEGTNDEVFSLIRQLFRIVEQLEAAVPGVHFTPDGVLLNGIGRAIAKLDYGITLDMKKIHEGWRDGRFVHIAATTRGSGIALSAEHQHLLAFKVLPNGEYEELFNGPGKYLRQEQPTISRQHRIGEVRLRQAMENVGVAERISRIR